MELENQEIPYGYTINDIDIVVDPLPAENVKFLFQKLEEYDKNPPKELVQNILEERKELTYEEAKSLVNFRDIVRYISKEVKIKNMVFTLSDAPATVETLRSILARPLDTFSNEELGKTCVEKMENM